jgi:hypothetical protein
MRFRWLAMSLVGALALAGLGACASSGLEGNVYRGKGYAFRVGKQPETWRRLEVADGALAFRDDANDGTVAMSGRCRIDGEDVPLAALTQHLFLQFTEREIVSQEVVPFDGREAMHTVLSAKLDGVPEKFDVWVLKKDGCVYDMYYFAQPARFDAGVGAFREFLRGFATEKADVD